MKTIIILAILLITTSSYAGWFGTKISDATYSQAIEDAMKGSQALADTDREKALEKFLEELLLTANDQRRVELYEILRAASGFKEKLKMVPMIDIGNFKGSAEKYKLEQASDAAMMSTALQAANLARKAYTKGFLGSAFTGLAVTAAVSMELSAGTGSAEVLAVPAAIPLAIFSINQEIEKFKQGLTSKPGSPILNALVDYRAIVELLGAFELLDLVEKTASSGKNALVYREAAFKILTAAFVPASRQMAGIRLAPGGVFLYSELLAGMSAMLAEAPSAQIYLTRIQETFENQQVRQLNSVAADEASALVAALKNTVGKVSLSDVAKSSGTGKSIARFSIGALQESHSIMLYGAGYLAVVCDQIAADEKETPEIRAGATLVGYASKAMLTCSTAACTIPAEVIARLASEFDKGTLTVETVRREATEAANKASAAVAPVVDKVQGAALTIMGDARAQALASRAAEVVGQPNLQAGREACTKALDTGADALKKGFGAFSGWMKQK